MKPPPAAAPLPDAVRAAAGLLAAYGVLVLVHAFVLNPFPAEGPGDVARPLVRAAGVGVVAWSLLEGRRWAWWLAIAAGAVFSLAGVAALAAFRAAPAGERVAVPAAALVSVALMSVLLAAAVGLLLRGDSRAAFR